jgi:hypothetical protein
MQADAQKRASLAKNWLKGSDPLQVAWGAFIVRQDKLDELTPLLLEQMRAYEAVSSRDGSYVEPADQDRHDAMLVVLDALIEMGKEKEVPVEQSKKLYSEFTFQSLILLIHSNDDARLSVLLDVFRTERFAAAWLAAGNVLVEKPQPGFAADLLAKHTRHLAIRVIDSKSGVGPGFGQGCCGDAIAKQKTGWPKVGRYNLTMTPDQTQLKQVLLSPGQHPVYYQRYESPYFSGGGSCDCAINENRDAYRAEYLKQLLTPNRKKDMDTSPVTIHWRSASDLQTRVDLTIQQQRDAFSRVVADLANSGLLTLEESAELKPRMEVTLIDNRTDQSTALPKITSADPLVTFK